MFSKLPFIHHAGNVSKIEQQYRQKCFVSWKEEAPFKDGLPVDNEDFSIGVLQHKAFKELATFVLTCLIASVSNAVAERIFFLVSSVKTKTRNRMQLNLLDTVLRVRAELLLSNKCCKDFTASPEILKKTSNWTRFMPYVPVIPVGRIVITWIRSFHVMYEKYIKMCLAYFWLFSSIAWLYIQMSIWQSRILLPPLSGEITI